MKKEAVLFSLTVFTDKKDLLPVYLGPAFYIVGFKEANHFKIGDQVTVHGEPFMFASTVMRGNENQRADYVNAVLRVALYCKCNFNSL